MDKITGGSILFWFVAMLVISAVTLAVCLIVTRFWPGVRVAWKTGIRSVLLLATAHAVIQIVNEIWYFEVVVGTRPPMTSVPLWLNLGSWVLEIGMAALVTFVVLRLRHLQGWVFFVLLAVLNLSRISLIDPAVGL